MRSPNKRIKNIRIRYQQVPYDDRYYYIDIKSEDYGTWVNISRIQSISSDCAIGGYKDFPANYLPYKFYLENNVKEQQKFLDELNISIRELPMNKFMSFRLHRDLLDKSEASPSIGDLKCICPIHTINTLYKIIINIPFLFDFYFSAFIPRLKTLPKRRSVGFLPFSW